MIASLPIGGSKASIDTPAEISKPVPLPPPISDFPPSPADREMAHRESPDFAPTGAAQVAPPLAGKTRAALAAASAAGGIDPTLAEEVAAILSGKPKSEPTVITNARRPVVVRMPSETWLLEACAGLNKLPEADRVVAFQAILRQYKIRQAVEQRGGAGTPAGN